MGTGPAEQRLLESIYSDLGADGPRRVYADWLVERGDPRGEFIHLQLDRFSGRSTPELFTRERALLREHHRAWTIAFHPTNYVAFERGFVTRVALDPGDAAEPGLSWSTVEELFIDGEGSIAGVLALVDSPGARHVCRVTAPFHTLRSLTDATRRTWRDIVLLTGGSRDNFIELSRRLPRLVTIGLASNYAAQIEELCSQPPILPAVQRLEVVWWDHGFAASSLARYFELVQGSNFNEFRWYDATHQGDLVLHRTGPEHFSLAEGHADGLTNLDDPPVSTTFDEIRVFWSDGLEPEDYDDLWALARRTDATLSFDQFPRARVLPTPEMEWRF